VRRARYDQRKDVRIYCARGSKLPQAKLSEDTAKQILLRYKPFCRVNGGAALAKEFGVHPNTIIKLTQRESWAHVNVHHSRNQTK
jgi:hypothetical protein